MSDPSTQDILDRADAKANGLRRRDVRPCDCCGKGLLEAGYMTAYRLRVESFVADPKAIAREHGLDLAFGPLGAVMGPDSPVLLRMSGPDEVLICLECMTRCSLGEIMDVVGKREEDEQS